MKSQRIYLQDILKRIDMIEEFTSDGREAFMQTAMIQESVMRSYEIIGEIVKRLDSELLASQPQISWNLLKGFRDILIHAYDKIDLEVVWHAVEVELPDLRAAVEKILANLQEGDADEEQS